MKKFNLKANISFEAENIDDAFGKLEAHFSNLKNGKDSDLISSGSIEVRPFNRSFSESETDKLFIIWSIEHQAWWCPFHKGYTKDRRDAGTYSFEEACRIVKDANIHNKDIPNEAMIEYIPMN